MIRYQKIIEKFLIVNHFSGLVLVKASTAAKISWKSEKFEDHCYDDDWICCEDDEIDSSGSELIESLGRHSTLLQSV